MPLIDTQGVFKKTAFKTNKKHTDLLMGNSEDSTVALILRDVAVGFLLISAPALSVALDETPMLLLNVVLAALLLFHQLRKIVLDSDSRFSNLINLVALLCAGAVGAYIFFPVASSSVALSFITVLTYANKIAVFINAAGFFADFLLPFIEETYYYFKPREALDAEQGTFSLRPARDLIVINKLSTQIACAEAKKQEEPSAVVVRVNKALAYLNQKRCKLINCWFGKRRNRRKIKKINALIEKVCNGEIEPLIRYFHLKALNRASKIKTIRSYLRWSTEKKPSSALCSLINDESYLEGINSETELASWASKPSLEQALRQVDEKMQGRLALFNGFLEGFKEVGFERVEASIEVTSVVVPADARVRIF